MLVEKMAQHYWLCQRAVSLQTFAMQLPFDDDSQQTVNNYARYQVTHERLFKSALHDLLKLRAEKRKAAIGFESQKRVEAQEQRRENAETRKAETHNFKAETHKLKTAILETRLEREKTNTFVKAAAAAKELEGVFPPEFWQQAA
jgi:ribosomal protein L3